jgi:hypothetical protein
VARGHFEGRAVTVQCIGNNEGGRVRKPGATQIEWMSGSSVTSGSR